MLCTLWSPSNYQDDGTEGNFADRLYITDLNFHYASSNRAEIRLKVNIEFGTEIKYKYIGMSHTRFAAKSSYCCR